MPRKETDIQKAILEYLQLRGIFAWRNNTTGTWDAKKRLYRRNNSINGVSDILGLLPGGRFLAIEVKTYKARKNVSPAQKAFIDNINNHGGLAFAATCVEDVMEIMEEK